MVRLERESKMNKDVRNRFLRNGIPYDDIDPEMITILDNLNFHIGLKTEFCCFGHDEYDETYIVFDSAVTDEEIFGLSEHLMKEIGNFGSFNKWVRSDGLNAIFVNWTFECCKFRIKDGKLRDEIKNKVLADLVLALAKYNRKER